MPASKPILLFISSTMPHDTGHGSAMRAGISLQALAAEFEVRLLVVQLNKSNRFSNDNSFASRYCADVQRVEPAQTDLFRTPPQGSAYDVLHVFRISAARFAEPYIAASHARQLCGLDLDDYESETHMRLSRLCAGTDDWKGAAFHLGAARMFRGLEYRYLRQFDRVFVSNPEDAERLRFRYGCQSVIPLPNAVRTPKCRHAPRGLTRTTYNFLFVGTMDYLPNVDAAVTFGVEILPLIRARLGEGVEFTIVGARPTMRIYELGRLKGVTVAGEVEDVRPYYERADAVVVPLRTGGGTRIKILEAFAFQRPVVATPAAVEGLAVTSGEHLLLASLPEEFASACVGSVQQFALDGMVRRAHQFVCLRHSVEAVRACFSSAYAGAGFFRSFYTVGHGLYGPGAAGL